MQRDPFPVPALPALAVAFASGLAVARVFPGVGAGNWVAVALGAALIAAFGLLAAGFLRHRLPAAVPICAAVLIFLLAGTLSGWVATPPARGHPALEAFYDRPRTLFAATVEAPPRFMPGRVQIPLRLDDALDDTAGASAAQGNRIPVGAGILLNLPDRTGGNAWLPGDRLLARLTVKRFHNFETPGGFDYVRYQAERGYFGRAYCSDPASILRLARTPPPFPLNLSEEARRGIERFRQDAMRWFRATLPPDAASFLAAMLLGYQKLISPEWNEHLSRTGLNHLVSISGLHLGLVALVVFWLGRRALRRFTPSVLARVPDQHLALFPAFAAAVLYACVSGFGSPPVWRSLIMLALCFGALLSYRGSDGVSNLSAAALLILVIDPNSLWQISFQLSFACMLGIFFIYPRIRSRKVPWLETSGRYAAIPRRVLAPFLESLRVSVAVSIVVLPLTVATFHGLSLALFVANVVVVPVMGFVVLPLGLASLGVFAASAWAATPLLVLAGWVTEFCQGVILKFSGLSWAYFWVGETGAAAVLFYYAALVALLSPLRTKIRAASATALLLAALLFPQGERLLRDIATHDLQLTVLDVGQGTSNFVRFPNGEILLVDGGGFQDRSYDMGRQVVAPFLWAEGVKWIDVVALSHDHPDHADGLRFILSHFNVGAFWETGETRNPTGKTELSEIARRRGIPVRGIMDFREPVTMGGCTVRVLHPATEYVESVREGDLNNLSLVLRIDYGATRLILPGDIERSVEELIAAREPPFAGGGLLVAAHHGSRKSTGDRILDWLHPQWVVFSCGYGNSYGFPSRDVLDRCAARGVGTLRTDLEGTIRAVSDGVRWRVSRSVGAPEPARAADAEPKEENGSRGEKDLP